MTANNIPIVGDIWNYSAHIDNSYWLVYRIKDGRLYLSRVDSSNKDPENEYQEVTYPETLFRELTAWTLISRV